VADPYVPGLAVARSVYDQGIAPLAQKVQGFLKGTAGLPGTVKDYALETIQSEGGPTTKVMADLLALGQGMSQGFQDNPLRAVAEMYPPVGLGSDLFEMGNLLTLAEQAEEAGDLEKAQTLRELANTIVLMGMVPGGPPAKKTIEQKLKEMTEKRQKLIEETGLPYVPSNKPDLGEGKRIDLNEPELDLLERERRLQQAQAVPRGQLSPPPEGTKRFYNAGTLDRDPSGRLEPHVSDWVTEVAEGTGYTMEGAPLTDITSDLVYMSDDPSWITSIVSRKLGKNNADVTLEDIRNHGRLNIIDAPIEDADIFKMGEFEEGTLKDLSGKELQFYETPFYSEGDVSGAGRMVDVPVGPEPGDFISNQPQEVKYSLTGDELIDFLTTYDPNLIKKAAGGIVTL